MLVELNANAEVCAELARAEVGRQIRVKQFNHAHHYGGERNETLLPCPINPAPSLTTDMVLETAKAVAGVADPGAAVSDRGYKLLH